MSQDENRRATSRVEYVSGDDGSGDFFRAGGDQGQPETMDEAMGKLLKR